MSTRVDLRVWRYFNRTEPESEPASSDLDGAVARLGKVVDRLPPGPFSAVQFVDHAIGLNAIQNINELPLILEHLTESGVIRQVNDGERPMWVVVD